LIENATKSYRARIPPEPEILGSSNSAGTRNRFRRNAEDASEQKFPREDGKTDCVCALGRGGVHVRDLVLFMAVCMP
jgi:hypothetical protein